MGKELYIQPFQWGNHEADVTPSENEFDAPALRNRGNLIEWVNSCEGSGGKFF